MSKLPSNILDTYERTTEANSPANNFNTGDVVDISDKHFDEDQLPELKQEENTKNILNKKSKNETDVAMEDIEEEILKETTGKFKTARQEADNSNEVTENLMRVRKTPIQESSDISSKMCYKNNEEEKQDSQNKSSVIKENDFKIIESMTPDKDLDTENGSNRKSLSAENKYFTGRLPTLLSRDESIRLTSGKGKEDGETNSNAHTEEGNSHLSQEIDKRNTSDAKGSSNSPLGSKANGLGKGDVKTIGGKPLSPTRHIQELLQEIKDPPNSNNHTSDIRPKSRNDHPFQSDTTSKPFHDAIMTVQRANEPKETSVDNEENGSINMTVDDINKVTAKVLGTNHNTEHHSRFDNMPQIKQIEEYVKQSKETEHEPQTNSSNDLNKLNETNIDDITSEDKECRRSEPEKTDNEIHSLPKSNEQVPQPPSSKKQSETNSEASKIPIENHQPFDPTSNGNKQTGSQNVNGSSTENDLKAIIASAKVAISTCTETTEESTFGYGTTDASSFSLHGDSVSHLKRRTATSRTTSKGMWSTTTQSDNQEALSSLICSNCLHADTRIHLSGYCLNCQQYLCNTCISVHNTNPDTRNHEIVPSYCKNELAVNKYVQATGYCADCSMFLCMNCVVRHCGFRANRHHKIIQSSFVSKSSDRKTEASVFLDKIQDKLEPDTSVPSADKKKDRQKKRKLLADLDSSNPYSSPFKHVPESLYPGPNKKVSQSYTKHPKWAHSSIPNLPYLVQPKPIPDRVFHAAGHRRPVMIYTKPKTGIDAMAAKFKSLKSKYKVKDSSKTARRREQALFTARPTKSRDGFSLPDIDSVKSHRSSTRTIKTGVVQNTKPAKKDIEFINEHCLSIPFPRGEKRTDILAMTILMDGRLVVLDKNNNNIKLYNKSFHCLAALQFQNRLMDICASTLCATDVYAATPKHVYEVSAIKGMDITRKMKVEMKRIEGMVSWKYGVAVITKKTNITWELWLLDYRGNLKSKLEVFNPFTLDIASSSLHHMTSSRGGKFVSITDAKNSCIITVDVTTRVVMHETMLEEGKHPSYLASDGDGNHNLFVACDNKVFQISKKGKVLGVLIDKARENGEVGCIIYNKFNNRMYIKTAKDMISVYQIYY